jgi:flagellar biosynthesis GTPase FlhF
MSAVLILAALDAFAELQKGPQVASPKKRTASEAELEVVAVSKAAAHEEEQQHQRQQQQQRDEDSLRALVAQLPQLSEQQIAAFAALKYQRARRILERYNAALAKKKKSLAKFGLHTWMFVAVACGDVAKVGVMIEVMRQYGHEFNVHYGGGFVPLAFAQAIVQHGFVAKCSNMECRRCHEYD